MTPPNPDSVPAGFSDDVSPVPYPEKPRLKERDVGQFLYRYENAYWTNWVIENAEIDASDDVAVHPEISVRDVRVRPVRDGYVAVAETTLLYRYEPRSDLSPANRTTPTATPIPSAPQTERTAYYVTDRFLLRQSPAPATERPSISGGAVVRCW